MNNLFNHKIINVNYQFSKVEDSGKKELSAKAVLHLPANTNFNQEVVTKIANQILQKEIQDQHIQEAKSLAAIKIKEITNDEIIFDYEGTETKIKRDDNAVNPDPLVKILSLVE